MSIDGKILADGWREWLASDEGQGCANAENLPIRIGSRQYLENRLWRAFMAGAKAVDELSTSVAGKQGEK